MQIPQSDLQQLQQLIQDSKEILILTPAKSTIDRMAATLALYLALPQLGKRVTVAAPDTVTVDISNLVGIDKVTNSLGNKNFVISLDYVEGSIEKVSYNIEGEKFNLVIEPRSNFAFSEDKVQYSYSGTNADLVIVVGASRLEDLGEFTPAIKRLQNAKIVNVDTHSQNARYGVVNLVFPGMASLSEVVVFLLSSLALTLDVDNATNLLSGITQATENFTTIQTTPDSFEAAAILLRAGAQKTNLPGTSPFSPLTGYQGVAPTAARKPFAVLPTTSQPRSFPQRTFSPLPSQPSSSEPASDEAPPPDWLKPKIFRSRGKGPNPNPPPGYTPPDGKGGLI